jgi:hypothetical protein
MQKSASSGLSIWHFGHFILSPPEIFLIENVERKKKNFGWLNWKYLNYDSMSIIWENKILRVFYG